MKPRKTTYLAHRWVGLIISLQLLAWSVGGVVFSVFDIDGVRGATDSRMRLFEPISESALASLPADLQSGLAQLEGVSSLHLVDRGIGAFWEVRGAHNELLARLDQAGNRAPILTPAQAQSLAEYDFIPEAQVLDVRLIESDPPSEYRGGVLPAYRVDMDHPKDVHIYIDANTGRVMARRNASWRTFDFFWMLHTMDYKGRDNFNHPLLIIASILAIATSGTGLVLWGWRSIPKLLKGKKKRNAKSRQVSA